MKHKVIIAVATLGLCALVGCTKGCSEKTPPPSSESKSAVTEDNGLKSEDLKVGDGDAVTEGKEVTVHYTGTLTDGSKFDSSVDRGQPFTFKLGEHHVIPGWEKGIGGVGNIPAMKVHGKRKLTIPPELGYGAAGSPPVIPPNSTLVFDVELLEIK